MHFRTTFGVDQILAMASFIIEMKTFRYVFIVSLSLEQSTIKRQSNIQLNK